MTLMLKNMSIKAGKELKITGVPTPNASGFAINVGHDDNNIAFHLNARFNLHGDYNTIVFNSRQGGTWASEIRDSMFPFQQGTEFKITVSFNNSEFQVKLPDGNTLFFPNRFGDDKYMHIFVEGDVRITGFKLK